MFSVNLTKAQFAQILEEMSDVDFARYRYCQEMAGTYLAVGQFEEMLINAMLMCNHIKVQKKLGSDATRWAELAHKQQFLQGSTIGSLIKILEAHDIFSDDIRYLRWIKEKRDYFIHRLFHKGAWPGELDEPDCDIMIRRLLAIQIWLERAQRNVWSIFKRAGFVELQHLADGGMLVMPTDLDDLFEASDEEEE